MEVIRVMGVIQAMVAAVAVVATLLEAAVLLEVAVIHQAVEAIHWEVEGIRLEVVVIPCRQRSQAAVGLYLYRQAKRDMMSAHRQTSSI